MDVERMKVTVIGFGKSGLSAAKLLHDKGAKVTVTDIKSEEELKEEIGRLENRKVERKTTTVTLIANLLRNLGKKIEVAGNIGIPLTEIVAKLDEKTIVLAEISSFQLEQIEKFRAYISIILNITPDHLDRYRSFRDYVNAKSRLLLNQESSDWAILNADDENVSKFAGSTQARVVRFSRTGKSFEEGVFLDSGEIAVRWEGEEERICSVRDIKIRGAHNLENCFAAIAVGLIYSAKVEIIKDTISEFPGLEHRLEYVKTINGIEFFNDSKATNVSASLEALNSFTSPVILICGGRDKESDYTVLRKVLKDRVKSVILLGEAKKKMKDAFGGVVPCVEADSLRDGVQQAYSAAACGDVVLLSPACSSFDMFRDFEERGKIFKAEVGKLT
jgi:UDP-N-acetylmuramoylalanine--D-glutamate ligase